MEFLIVLLFWSSVPHISAGCSEKLVLRTICYKILWFDSQLVYIHLAVKDWSISNCQSERIADVLCLSNRWTVYAATMSGFDNTICFIAMKHRWRCPLATRTYLKWLPDYEGVKWITRFSFQVSSWLFYHFTKFINLFLFQNNASQWASRLLSRYKI